MYESEQVILNHLASSLNLSRTTNLAPKAEQLKLQTSPLIPKGPKRQMLVYLHSSMHAAVSGALSLSFASRLSSAYHKVAVAAPLYRVL